MWSSIQAVRSSRAASPIRVGSSPTSRIASPIETPSASRIEVASSGPIIPVIARDPQKRAAWKLDQYDNTTPNKSESILK